MTYYNHFSDKIYSSVKFADLNVGDKFRNDFFKNGRRRSNIICIKTGKLTYVERKSKKEYKLFSTDNFIVYSYEQP